jgi:hypothetical protein
LEDVYREAALRYDVKVKNMLKASSRDQRRGGLSAFYDQCSCVNWLRAFGLALAAEAILVLLVAAW